MNIKVIDALFEKHHEAWKENYVFGWYQRDSERIEKLYCLHYFLNILRPNLEEICAENYMFKSIEEIVNICLDIAMEDGESHPDADEYICIWHEDLTPYIENYVKNYFKKVANYTLKLAI